MCMVTGVHGAQAQVESLRMLGLYLDSGSIGDKNASRAVRTCQMSQLSEVTEVARADGGEVRLLAHGDTLPVLLPWR